MPCFLLPVSAAAVTATWASASAAIFSVTIRAVSASALAPPWAIRKQRRNMTACASQHIRVAWSDNASVAFQGQRTFDIEPGSLETASGPFCDAWSVFFIGLGFVAL